MKNTTYLIFMVIFVLSSCLSTKGDSSTARRLEERLVSETLVFTDDELEIYDFVIDFLLAKYSRLVPQEAMTELINKYGVQGLIQNPTLVDDAAVQIENPKIVVADKTTIPSLSTRKTFSENMEDSLKYITEKMGMEYDELFLDFKLKNEFDYSLANYISANDKAISADLVRAAIGDAEPTSYWTKFYEINPNACGRITLSRVGFQDNHAFIEVQFIKGSMDGFIDYVILEKFGDSWDVVKSNRHVYY